MPTVIRYERSDGVTPRWTALVQSLAAEPAVVEILDVGGGANPILPSNVSDARCTLADIDPNQLAKAPDDYDKQVVDFSAEVDLGRSFDLIISHFVCEHIADPAVFHQNILDTLGQAAGRCISFLPCMHHLLF